MPPTQLRHSRFHPPLRLGLLRRVRPAAGRDDALPPTPPAEKAKLLRAYHWSLCVEFTTPPCTLEELFAEHGLRLEDWPEPPEPIHPWQLRSRNRLRKPFTRGVPEKHKARWRNDEAWIFSNPLRAEKFLDAYVWSLEMEGVPVPGHVVAQLSNLRAQLGLEPR